MAVDSADDFPLLLGRALNLCVRLAPAEVGQESRFAIIPLGSAPQRFFRLPSEQGHHYILLEDVIRCFADRFFPGVEVLEVVPFRITRNADMGVREDMAADLMAGMEEVLDARKQSHCVRLEVASGASRGLLQFLRSALEIDAADVYEARAPWIVGLHAADRRLRIRSVALRVLDAATVAGRRFDAEHVRSSSATRTSCCRCPTRVSNRWCAGSKKRRSTRRCWRSK
jgi:polyphosphate kinase